MNEQQYINAIKDSRSERTVRHFLAIVEEHRGRTATGELTLDELDTCLTRASEETLSELSPRMYHHCTT